MKKLLFIAFCTTFIMGCNKTSGGNKDVIPNENNETKTGSVAEKNADPLENSLKKSILGETMESTSFTYKGMDGSRAKITFNNDLKAKTITIESGNGKKIDLDKKSSGLYERNGIKAVLKIDSLFITQGDNVIPLSLDK